MTGSKPNQAGTLWGTKQAWETIGIPEMLNLR